MDYQKTIALVKNAKAEYESAVTRKMNVTAKKQEYINILMSHADELLAIGTEAAEFEKQFVLECAESARLRKELNDLKASVAVCDEAEQQDKPTPVARKKNG